MMATSSDTLMKAISEVFGSILTHFDRYSADFLQNLLFKFFQCVRPIFKSLFPQVAPQEKITNAQIRWVHGPPYITSQRTRFVGNICRSFVIETRAVCAVAPSCWNQIPSMSFSPISFSNWSKKFKQFFQHWNITLNVNNYSLSILLKKIKPNHPKFWNCTPYGHFWGVKRSLVNWVWGGFQPNSENFDY